MKPTLQLKLGQSLTMTPQLQQAIRLLQLSTLDLQQEIQSILDANPMLEIPEEGSESGEDSTNDGDAAGGDRDEAAVEHGANNAEQAESAAAAELTMGDNEHNLAAEQADWQDTIPEDLPVDTKWDDIYSSMPASSAPASSQPFNEMPDLENRQSRSETLSEN